MKHNFFQVPFEQKSIADTESGITIRGLASTRNIDRYGDSVEPTAFAKSIETFMKNPIMLLQHNQNKPIGKFHSAEVVADGLEVVGEILHNTDNVVEQVKSGTMQAFSIGYLPTKWEIRNADGVVIRNQDGFQNGFGWDALLSQKNTRTISELDLVEISVVAVPANAHSVFSIEASTKSFFDDMEKSWQEEMKSLEENTNTDTPPSGDELVDTDNVANEVLSSEASDTSEAENANDVEETLENSTENVEAENSETSVQTEEKSLVEEKTMSVLESKEYKDLEAKYAEVTAVAKSLVEMVEALKKENAEMKNTIASIPVRKGLANIGGNTPSTPKKSYIQALLEEARNS